MNNLPFTITALHDAYRKGIGADAIVNECYDRIEAIGDPGIFLHLIDRQTVLQAATALGDFDPATRPLWGVPFAIKDNIDAADLPTTAACPDYAYTAEADAFVVAKLRKAGALLIGKTNLDQFATGLVGVRTPYPVPKNATDPAIAPGGSSSGSAVAVAHGLVSFSLGTDTAGSGRVPAALNNIVGLKPTLGSLSATGVVPACRTLDTISIFALTVPDAWRAFEAAAGYDPEDAYSKSIIPGGLGEGPPHFTLGVPDKASRKFFGDTVQAASFDAALDRIAALGGTIRQVDFEPFYEIAQFLYNGAWVAERLAVIETRLRDNPATIHPVTRAIVGKAEGMSAVDVFNDIYAVADLKRAVMPVLNEVDMLAVPTIPNFVTLEELAADPIGPNSRLGTYTNFVNLLDLCGIAVPLATRSDGRPGSVTLLAKAGADHLAAGLAQRLHAEADVLLGATGWTLNDECGPEPTAGPDEIAIAAVGAHMSGLPLNGELTGRGGRFLKTAVTADGYRLYALAGGPPARPGLMRDATGSAIALEIWALPMAQAGGFLAGIPAPLGLGTVSLSTGETVNGFICEAAGLEGATDITEFGGWRNFLQSKAAVSAAR